jgi:hypothetical protein
MLSTTMLRAAALGLALDVALIAANYSQEMRIQLKEYALHGPVQSVETVLVDTSTKSYKFLLSGREVLHDFGNPSASSPDGPLLWEVLKFDTNGRLIEDIDVERPLIEQQSYRYVYTYDFTGRLIEKAGYGEDSESEGKNVYRYDSQGKKVEQVFYPVVGRIQARYEFDEHENIISIERYREDGSVAKEAHRYEYTEVGNTLEQLYYPPQIERGHGYGYVGYAALVGSPARLGDAEEPSLVPTPPRYRTVYVHDDRGRIREENSYDVDGSVIEKKSFDELGVLRKRDWHIGLSSTMSVYDDFGRVVEVRTLARKGFGSPRAVDDRSAFTYDGHGNLTEMVATGADGSLVARTTNLFEYDSHGNWIKKTETVLNNTWQTEPFPAAFETIREFRRTISYFPKN